MVTGPDGGKHAQAKLNEILGPLSFDPQAFFSLAPKRQREILLSIGHDPGLATKLDGLRAERSKLYEERTPWISRQRDARKVTKPEGERPEPVDTGAAMAELRDLQAQDREREDARRRVAEEQQAVDRFGSAISAKEAAIVELRRQLAAAQDDLEDLQKSRRRAEVGLQVAEQGLEAFPDPSDAIQACMDRISSAEAVQRALRPWQAWDDAQVLLGQATDKVADLTRRMEATEASEHQIIAAAGIPVRGLSFDEGGAPLLNGRPLELASGGERIELAVDVALAVDPELRICLVDEANDLDLEAMDRLRRRAEQHGFQVWLCRIGLEGPGHVTVAAGKAESHVLVDATQANLEF